MKSAVVITTIHVPDLLAGYRDNFERYGHLEDVTVYVIPDRKTPREAKYCIESLRKDGLRVEFPDLQVQDLFLRHIGLKPDFIPRDSDNRRNVGYLMAMVDGANYVISLDDDNYCVDSMNWLGGHIGVLKPQATFSTIGPWFNPCDDMFARGFPYYRRKQYVIGCELLNADVRVNEGLWHGTKDLDGMTHLHCDDDGTYKGIVSTLALGPETWAPINSQNTAIARPCLPAYYFLRSPRFGDIYQGYFLLACLKQVGWTARFGTPIVDHRRNSHDYLRDAELELPDIRALEEFLPRLVETKLSGSTISEAYSSLIPIVAEYLSAEKAEAMATWLAACTTIGV